MHTNKSEYPRTALSPTFPCKLAHCSSKDPNIKRKMVKSDKQTNIYGLKSKPTKRKKSVAKDKKSTRMQKEYIVMGDRNTQDS